MSEQERFHKEKPDANDHKKMKDAAKATRYSLAAIPILTTALVCLKKYGVKGIEKILEAAVLKK